MRFGRGYPISRILIPPPKYLQTVADNSALSAAQTTLASGTPFTWAHTAATNCYAIVAVYGAIPGASLMTLAATAAVTFGGQALSELGSVYANNNSASTWIRVFGGNTVPSGGQTVSVTLTQAGKTFSGRAASFTYTNVSAVGTLQTAFGSSGSSSVAVPTTVGNMVWGSTETGQGSTTFTGFSLTQRQTQNNAVPCFMSGDTAAASSSVTVSENHTGIPVWAAAGLNLIPIG